MANVGSVEVNVRLGLQQLQADAKKAQADLEKALDDVTVTVNAEGLKEATQQFNQFKKAAGGGLGDIVPKSTGAGVAELARTLALTFKEAKNLASGLNLSASQANAAISTINNLNSVNASAVEKFRVLRKELGISKQQYLELEQAVASAQERLNVPAKFDVGSGTDITELARNLNLTFKESKNFASGIQLSADQANRAIATIKNLNSTNATTVEKFRVLHKELGITKEQYLALEQAIADTNKQLKGFDGVLQSAKNFTEAVSAASLYTQALRDVSQILGQAGQQFNQFNQQALAASTAFDDAQGKVGTLTQDVDGLTSALGQLTKDLDYQANTTSLLNASYDVLSSGFSDTADVTEILRVATLGAQGGFTDVGTVTDALTTIMNAYGLEASDAARITDILAQTQDKGKITIGQYAGQIGEVASTAALAGVDLEELSAAIATATAKGQTASASISGVRQAMVNLLKPTEEAQRKIDELLGPLLGVESVDTGKLLDEQGLVGVLELLDQAGANTADLSKVFSDVTGLATVSTLAGENLGDFNANLDAMANSAGKASASAEVVAATFSNQMAKAFNLANESLVQAGKGIQAALLPLIDSIVFLLENFLELPAPIQQAIGIIAALTGGTLALASAIASIAAIVPIVTAATGALTANTIATAANTGATQANALAKGAQAAATGQSTTAVLLNTAAMSKALLVVSKLALALGVLVVAMKAARWLDYVGDIKDTNQALDELETTANAAADGALSAVGRTKKAAADAAANGGKLTAEQLENAKKLAAANDLRIAQADEELTKLEALRAEVESRPQSAATEAQLGSINALIASTTRSRDALATQNNALKENAGITEDATSGNYANAEAVKEQASAVEQLSASYAKANAEAELGSSQEQASAAEEFAAGDITEDEYQERVLAAERDTLNKRLEQNRAFLTQLRDLQATTQDPKELAEVNEAILQTEEAIAADRIAIAQQSADARVQAEEEATQKILDNLEQQSSDAQTQSDIDIGGLDITSQRLSEQQSLLSAQNDLLSAQFAIREQTLQSAIDEAEANENSVEATRLKNQLEQERGAFIDQQFAIQRQQLELEQEQRALSLEREKILADIAVVEAEIAIERAKAEGASAQETANLERILGLREKQRDAVDSAISNQEKINTLEDQTLTANQELEHLKNEQASAREDENDALDEQKEKLEEIKALEDELRQIRADTQKAKNDAAVGAAEAEYDANPSKRNLDAVHDAREKALEDEFNARQAELDAESADRIAKAEEEATAAAEAYNAAMGELSTEADAAWSDGTLSAEEEEKLNLLQQQNDEAREQVDAAQDQLGLEKQIADAKQTQLDTEKKAAQEAEKAKQKKETEEARAAGLLSGVQGSDVNTLTKARNELRALQERVSELGLGNQVQELLSFAQRDNEFGGQVGQINDILLNQLGGLGEAALNLEAIADGGQVGLSKDLARQLDQAQKLGDSDFYNKLIAKVEELARAANAPKTVNVYGGTGETGQVIRELQRAESGARY